MKRLLLAGLPVLLLLTGCARHYVLTLNNGSRITTHGKPKLQEGFYVFKDARGEPGKISAGRVSEISPASMVKNQGGQFLPSTTK